MLLAAVALFVALGGPASAAKTIKKALFATEAGSARKVDGLSASKRPKPNTLLALNKNGKFPSSVGAIGPRGLQGAQGAQGPQGDRGSLGAAGSAVSYARIFFDPPDGGGAPDWRADDRLSKRIDNTVNFRRVSAGEYCFHDLPFTVSNAVATLGGKLPATKSFAVTVAFRNATPGLQPADCDVVVYVYNVTSPAAPVLDDPIPDDNEIYVTFN
jgi:hypothetical protein